VPAKTCQTVVPRFRKNVRPMAPITIVSHSGRGGDYGKDDNGVEKRGSTRPPSARLPEACRPPGGRYAIPNSDDERCDSDGNPPISTRPGCNRGALRSRQIVPARRRTRSTPCRIDYCIRDQKSRGQSDHRSEGDGNAAAGGCTGSHVPGVKPLGYFARGATRPSGRIKESVPERRAIKISVAPGDT